MNGDDRNPFNRLLYETERALDAGCPQDPPTL